MCSKRNGLKVAVSLLLNIILILQQPHLSSGINYKNYKNYKTSLIRPAPLLKTALVATCLTSFYCLQVVQSGDECLIERFGKYHRTLGPGWHFILRPFEIVRFHQTLREQVLDVPPQQCFTLDNAPLKADAVLYMRIVSMNDACYNVLDVNNAILNLCLTQVREQVGKLTLDESFRSRDRLNSALLHDLNAVCQGWGVEITRVEIQNLEPSRDILQSMEMQMAAERKKRAAILQSEGERTKLINEAEGRAGAMVADSEARRKSAVLKAEGEAERLRLEADGIRNVIEMMSRVIAGESKGYNYRGEDGKFNPPGEKAVSDALQLLSLVRYLETQGKFAASNGTKVLMFPSKDSLPLTYEGLQNLLKP